MNKVKRKMDTAIAAAAMIFLILAVLITSFWAAVYADPHYRFFEKEYQKYNVTADLDMEMNDVMEVTDYMMSYLIGEKEELSIVTMVDGQLQDFFNEQDRLHMEDVRKLFLAGLKFGVLCLGVFLLLMVMLLARKAELGYVMSRAYSTALGFFLMLIVILGALFASDFTKYFTIFHEIFFTNDLWIFDPSTDYMIRMLPEGFFSDILLRIGVVFVSALVFVGFVFAGIKRIWLRHRINKNGL